MIYVIGEKGSPVVKIGFTGGKPSKRLGEIQNGNPATLAVLWAGEGDKTLEGRLHTTFRPYHVRGEWYDFGVFDPVEEVRAAISSISRGVAHAFPVSQLPNCVCGHKRSKHGTDGCSVTGYQEWEDCPCSAYVSSAVLEGVAPISRTPAQRTETKEWAGPTPPEANANREHRWHETIRREIEGMRWPEGASMVPDGWSEPLADRVIWRLLGCEESSRYPGVVLDEILRFKWAHGGSMVPGAYAEDLTDRITARLT